MRGPEVLITGSSGIIGSVLRQGLPYTYRQFDRPEHDARNYEQVIAGLLGCAAVVHLAWNTTDDHFRSDYTDPANYAMAQNVYHAAIHAGVPRVIIASSIHADMPRSPIAENSRSPYQLPEPDSPYGATKAGIEALGRYFAQEFEQEVICIRFGWVSNNPNDHPSPTKPYPPTEGWLSHADCIDLVTHCIAATELPSNYQILWGLSRRETGGIHDLNNEFWQPQATYNAPVVVD